jgi:hypothetical protein
MKEGVLASPDIRTAGDVYPWPRTGQLSLSDVDGASVGDDVTQRNKAVAKVRVGAYGTRSVQRAVKNTDSVKSTAHDAIHTAKPPSQAKKINRHPERTAEKLGGDGKRPTTKDLSTVPKPVKIRPDPKQLVDFPLLFGKDKPPSIVEPEVDAGKVFDLGGMNLEWRGFGRSF